MAAVGRTGPEPMLVSGAPVSTVQERVASVASALPAASVARTEKMWAPSASPVERVRRRAGLPAAGVELALEGRRRSPDEVNASVAELVRVSGDGPDPIDVVGRHGVDGPGARGLGGVGVAGGVGGAHAEGVGALREAGERARRGAGCQAPSSSLHSKVAPGRVEAEAEGGRGGRHRAGRAGADRRVGRDRVDGPGACRPRWRRCCRRRRWPERGSVGSLREAA